MIVKELKLILNSGHNKFLFFIFYFLFLIIYVFAWNMILLPNFYVRQDLWTALNIFFLLAISFLSSLVLITALENLRQKLALAKEGVKILAIVPALFTSACSSCAPLILSFSSSTYSLGMSLAAKGDLIKSLAIILLSVSLYLNLRDYNKNKSCLIKK